MSYEVILFDADETLFDFKKTEQIALDKLMNHFNTDFSKEYLIKTYKDINTNIWREFEEGNITSDKINVERFKRLINTLSLDDDPTEICDLYTLYLGEGSYLYKESEELLEYLSSRYRIAIITNGLAEVQHKRIRESTINHYFEEVVISDEIKISKPNKEIFEYTLDKLNHLDKSTVLMIGDSLTSDIRGGINSEIDTCWCNLKNLENKTSINAKYEINSLLELRDII